MARRTGGTGVTIHPCDLHSGNQPPTQQGLDSADLCVLAIQRHLFHSFAQPERQGWMTALVTAITAMGDDIGPRLFAAVTAQVQAMRQARGAMFVYSDPHCPHCRQSLTPDETLLATCLRTLRQGRLETAGRHALILCEGEPPTRFLDATAGVVALLPLLPGHRLN
jgi:hypothetical protein